MPVRQTDRGNTEMDITALSRGATIISELSFKMVSFMYKLIYFYLILFSIIKCNYSVCIRMYSDSLQCFVLMVEILAPVI